MIYCNECKYEFDIKPRVKHYSKGVEEVFFNCPHCHERYTSYFTNPKIRKQQRIIRSTKDQILIKKLQVILKKDMDNLKEKMLGTLN
jgi:hypothetical protein